ncbi:PTS sugar transporter subunit IIC [Actinomyces qiguomingii]|uniref:PTS sugar transporter subunit IIC n=1 Tax=Actinomyces qiguomingii TaxID=2057800 RepID=UPI000CA03AA2|nr:PTS transporter subunit EIIC [Actinomyces qiguomingii]
MPSLSDRFSDGLTSIAEKVDDNKYLNSLKNSFSYFLPFILVGSFASLLRTLVSSQETGLARWVPALASLDGAFTAMNFATMSFMTIPIVILLGWQLAKRNGTPTQATAVLCVAAYVTVVPHSVQALLEDGSDGGTAAGLGDGALGAQGLFIGIIWTVAITELFRWLSGIKALRITMPDSVPPAITQSFNSLIPVFLILTFSAVFGVLFRLGTGSYLNEWVYAVLQHPLESIFQSTAGIILMAVFAQLFWFLGIHGGLVISPIRNPLFATAIAANIAAVNAGAQPTQPLTYGFWVTFIVLGGAGGILGLTIVGALISKQEDLRMISRLGFVPAVCGISEPLVFGVPLVLNPLYAIPFIFNTGISAAIALGAMNLGFIQANTVDVPFGVPIFINGFIGFGWQGIVVQAVILAATTLMWLPFVAIDDRRAAKEALKEDSAALSDSKEAVSA